MPGIRVDRFLASTALLLLLSSAAGAALADPTNTAPAATTDAASPTPAAATAPPATPADSDKAATPGQATDHPKDAAPDAAPAASAPAPAPAPAATAPAVTSPPTGSADAPAASPAAAPPPAAAATPGITLSGADAPIADQLRNLANGKFDHTIGDKKNRAQIDAFYSGRNYAPLWITDGKANARASAAIAYLGHVDADGLDPADYPVLTFDPAATPADLAEAEIKLTTTVITYAHHASIGRVHWSRVSADIDYTATAPEPADVLAAIVGASDVAAALDAYEPHTPGYLALKAKLADIRAGKIDKGNTPIGNGPVLKTGMQDDRVPALRERLGVPGDGGTTYDKPVADAVKKFQQERQIGATGTLTSATLEALNGKQPDHQADIVLANMERWRWAPHQFPDTYVIVNLPDFTLRVMHDGKLVWMTKIVDGKPDLPTPIMTADMKYITINPTWNVPPSIINHEYLPALQQDPQALERIGLKVTHNPDGTIRIYQPPGDKNALGRIRFNFPNKFLVYQHDTPDKNLFAYDKRAFSHGCMRVQDPQHYAEVLLSLVRPSDGYTEDRIKKMIAAGGETDIQFPTFVPVNLTYQTAFVDDAGKLQFRDDVYGRDRALLAIHKGDDRKVADIAIEHKVDISHREVMAIPDQPSLFGRRSIFGGGDSYYPGSGGDNFFSRLFGGGFAAAPPVPHRPVAHPRKETRARDNTVAR
jgi:murein L,D-transpeptidase YcbB/YkuD